MKHILFSGGLMLRALAVTTVMLGITAADAATLINHVSSDVSIAIEIDGLCGSNKPQILDAVDRFDYRLWDTGRVSIKDQMSGLDIDAETGRTLGKVQSQLSEVGYLEPFDGNVVTKDNIVCKGSGKIYSYTCAFHVANDGSVTFSGQCAAK